MKKIRILFVSHDASLYGAQLSLLGLLENLDRSRFEPWVITHHEGPLVKAIRGLNIPVSIYPIIHWVESDATVNASWFNRIARFIKRLRNRAWRFAHLVEQNNIDVVYTNTITCIEGAIAAKMTKRPHVWHLREQVRGNSQLCTVVPTFLIPWIIYFLSWRVIVNSHYLYRAYSQYPLNKKLTVVYNGVDPKKFDINHKEASYTLRTELNLPSSNKIVAIIGSVIPRKGQLLFARAASLLVPSLSDITFLIIGEGSSVYLQVIQKYIEENSLEPNFRFLGWRQDIPKILAAIDLLVIAAEEEPFGRTVIEAMAAEVPVVSTRCGGPEEIILDEITGLLVPRDNPVIMAQAMKRILSNPIFSAGLVKAGKSHFNQKFTLQTYSSNIQTELESVVNSHDLVREKSA